MQYSWKWVHHKGKKKKKKKLLSCFLISHRRYFWFIIYLFEHCCLSGLADLWIWSSGFSSRGSCHEINLNSNMQQFRTKYFVFPLLIYSLYNLQCICTVSKERLKITLKFQLASLYQALRSQTCIFWIMPCWGTSLNLQKWDRKTTVG